MGEAYGRIVDYRVLGTLEVRVDGAPIPLGGPKQRGVLAVLVAMSGRPVAVDTLLQATYGEDAAPGGRATLQTFVSNLRHALGDVITRQGNAYFVDCTGALIDATSFEDAYRAATAMGGDADDVSSLLREALAMWRGHPYADIEAHGFLDGEITRLTELRLAALESRIDADLRAGRHREVIAELDALTVEHPFRENLRALHMLALYRSGRQGEALRAYGQTRAVLAEGLGIDPSPELKDLQRRILDQDRSLLIAVGPTVRRGAVVVADLDDSGWYYPAERELAFAHRESDLAAAAVRAGGIKLAPKGTAGYAVFAEPIDAVRAARQVVNERTRLAVDFGDLEIGGEEPVGPPLARAARLVAVAHPGQVLLSSTAHEALTASAGAGWAAESLGCLEIVGLDPGLHIYQLVGGGFRSDFPELLIDRLPPVVPSPVERSVPGYELRALIDASGLGEVHRAYQSSVGREVAVRIFGPEMVGHPQFVRRFETACQRITRVEHPRVVPLLDYWREPNRAVMVSRLMTGGHLGQRIPTDGFATADALAIFETVASGVASAHRHGVVHGRVRPENVLFDDEGNAFVADLGVDEICTGIVTFATDAYDAPERLGGALATPVADVYSLGVLLHHLLGGSPPPADGRLPLGPGPADVVVARSTDPDPDRRQRSVDELVGDVRQALSVASDPTAAFLPTRNPYRGLAAFEQADAEDFHGRRHAIALMVDVLQQERLLVVVGPSGIGKSSAVKAGLLPTVAGGTFTGSETWLATEMVPGRSPFEALASALGRVATVAPPDVAGELAGSVRSLDDITRQLLPSDTELVVVIDQLEELFTLTVDDAERRAFLQMVVDVAHQRTGVVRLVATVRADYFDRPLAHPGFADAIEGRTVALGAMSAAELADAIRLPAGGVGVEVAPTLVDRITSEAASQPGALPLVQHTMAELFAHRDSTVITLAAFEEAGGLAGSIGRRAEAIYLGFDDRRRDAARRLFLRLVTVSEDHDDTRRRVRRTELEQSGIATDDIQAVLDDYGRHRLLTFDRDPSSRTPTVEVAHEALLTDWQRFRSWVDDAREDLLIRRRLESAANDWVRAGSDPSFLYRGGRLELAESWEANSGFALTDDERRFLATSRAKVDRDRVARTRRRRLVVGALLVALAAVTVGAVVALVQRGSAEREAGRADRAAVAADARRVGVQALLADDFDQSLLLAAAGVQLDDSADTRADLLAALSRNPDLISSTRIEGSPLNSLEVSPDGKVVAVGGFLDRLSFFDTSTLEPIDTYDPEDASIWKIDYRADGAQIVMSVDGCCSNTGAPQPSVRLVDAATLNDEPIQLGGIPASLFVGPPHYSDDGRFVAVSFESVGGGDTTAVAVWNLASPQQPALQFELPGGERGVELSPDGSVLYVGYWDPPSVTVYDVATGRELRSVDGVIGGLMEVSPDGSLLAASGWTDVVLLDAATLKEVRRLQGHSEQMRDISFSPSGALLASGSDDRSAIVWDVATGGRKMELQDNSAGVWGVGFSAAEDTLYTVAGRTLLTWDLTGQRGLIARRPLAEADAAGVFAYASPSGDAVVYRDGESHAQFRDLETGRASDVIDTRHGLEVFSWRPDGARYATAGTDGFVRLWDPSTGQPVAERRLASTPIMAVAYTPDGERLIIGDDTRVSVIDAETLQPDGPTIEMDQAVVSASTSPDGHRAIVMTTAGYSLVDLDEGRVIREGEAPHSSGGEFSPDGRRFAVGFNGGRMRVLDVETGEWVGPQRVGHDGGIFAMDWAPDGSMFATGGDDFAIVFWDPDTGAPLSKVLPSRPGDGQMSPQFLPDGRTLLLTAPGGAVYTMDLSIEHWIDSACAIAGRNLTEDEWRDAFGDRPYRQTCPRAAGE
jgi:WD40 repeat protein/DNA-binding SARP family transcriptional activator/serine/threonine protein kinase